MKGKDIKKSRNVGRQHFLIALLLLPCARYACAEGEAWNISVNRSLSFLSIEARHLPADFTQDRGCQKEFSTRYLIKWEEKFRRRGWMDAPPTRTEFSVSIALQQAHYTEKAAPVWNTLTENSNSFFASLPMSLDKVTKILAEETDSLAKKHEKNNRNIELMQLLESQSAHFALGKSCASKITRNTYPFQLADGSPAVRRMEKDIELGRNVCTLGR